MQSNRWRPDNAYEAAELNAPSGLVRVVFAEAPAPNIERIPLAAVLVARSDWDTAADVLDMAGRFATPHGGGSEDALPEKPTTLGGRRWVSTFGEHVARIVGALSVRTRGNVRMAAPRREPSMPAADGVVADLWVRADARDEETEWGPRGYVAWGLTYARAGAWARAPPTRWGSLAAASAELDGLAWPGATGSASRGGQ